MRNLRVRASPHSASEYYRSCTSTPLNVYPAPQLFGASAAGVAVSGSGGLVEVYDLHAGSTGDQSFVGGNGAWVSQSNLPCWVCIRAVLQGLLSAPSSASPRAAALL